MIAVAAVVVFQTTNIKSVISISLAQGFSIFTLATVLSVLFSIPMYVFVERPFIQWAKNKNSPPMV
jgi:peptidoglycan/LPS O-acetylase OafA/YrhL